MEHRFHLRLEIQAHYRLSDSVCHRGDGDFILLLLQVQSGIQA